MTVLLTLSPNLYGEASDGKGAAAGAARIELSVAPERLILGSTTDAHVRATVRSAKGEPLSCEDIRIDVSQGEITDVAQAGLGEYSAKYLLPGDFFPRFALIVASAVCSNQTITGNLVVELFGTGAVELKFEPNTDVVLEIAEEKFGPYRTDKTGKVKIPIVVPPGVQTGRVGDEEIDLNLPPVNRIVAIPEKGFSAVPGDEAVILVYAIDAKSGEPVEDAKLRIKPNKGRISKIVPAAPGVYRAYYRPPSNVGYGKDDVSISLRGDSVSETTITMQLVAGMAARVTIDNNPEAYRAGDDKPVSIAIRITDENGNPTDGEIDAGADFGQVENLRSFAPGEYRAQLVLPNDFKGRKQARITAQLSKHREIGAESAIALVPGEPASLAFDSRIDRIPADGFSTTDIAFELRDPYGNLVPNREISTTASKGSTPPVAVADGEKYTIPFTPPVIKGRKPGHCTITASVGEVRAETTVALGSRSYLMAVTPSVGYITNLKNIHAPLFSVPVDWSLSFALNGLYLGLDLGYYFDKGTYSPSSFTSTLHAFLVGGALGYRIKIKTRLFISPNFTCGGVFLVNKIVQDGLEDRTYGAGQLYFGPAVDFGFRLGPGYIVSKLGYQFAEVDKLEFYSGKIGGLNVHVGYRFEFL